MGLVIVIVNVTVHVDMVHESMNGACCREVMVEKKVRDDEKESERTEEDLGNLLEISHLCKFDCKVMYNSL